MDLGTYVDSLQHHVLAAASAQGDEARAVAERLLGPLDATIRLTVQDALAAAAEEITCELAPGSVELRLRGREVEFAVSAPPVEAPPRERGGGAPATPGSTDVAPTAPGDGDDGGMARINLRLPDQLKARVEQAAGRAGLSVNAWLVRAAAAAVDGSGPEPAPAPRGRARFAPGAQHYTGWAR